MATLRTSRLRSFARAGTLLRLGALLAGCALLPAAARAQAAATAPQYELSNAASDEIGPIREDLKSDYPQKCI